MIKMTDGNNFPDIIKYIKLSYLGTNILVYHISFKIGYNIKGFAKTYNLLMNFNNNIVKETQNKWEGSLNEEIPYHIVEKPFTQIQSKKEGSFTKYLQFKMLHRRIKNYVTWD